jgi:hypothetical protein
LCGFTLAPYDRASRFAWLALRAMSTQQVRAATDLVLAADNATVNDLVLRRVPDPAEERNEWDHRVFGLYNGTDGIAPPVAFGRTFTPHHSHYMVTEQDVLDSGDVETAIQHVMEHFVTPANS